jgi:signal transduction histidine kinase
VADVRTAARRDNEAMTRFADMPRWRARAVAFVRSTEPRPALTGRAAALDALLAFAAAVASLTASTYHGAGGGPQPAALASVFITTMPLALRRVFPLTTFWIIVAGIVFGQPYTNLVTAFAFVLAGYSAVAHSRFRGAAVLGVLLAGLVMAVAISGGTVQLPGRFAGLLILIPVALVGNAVHLWRREAGDSQQRLAHAQDEHEAATLRALAAERSRIAAELHDVVTHNVSVMVVQAGAARRVLAASPADARAALLAVEASGRTAMVELQHLLGLLSPVEGMQAHPESGGPDAAPLQPQPGLGELAPLVDRVAGAGLPVDLTVNGQPRALPAGLDLTAYRVVQEALTNVMKHAGAAAAVVTLDYREDAVVIDVSDDGGRGRQAAVQPGRDASPARSTGGGRGLLGLRERLLLYGGDFDAGPRPAGGWRVTARLPDRAEPAGCADAGNPQAGLLAPAPAAS